MRQLYRILLNGSENHVYILIKNIDDIYIALHFLQYDTFYSVCDCGVSHILNPCLAIIGLYGLIISFRLKCS